MTSLYNNKIKIDYNFDDKEWSSIIKYIYNKKFKKFNFQLNSELIDVDNRFRLILYKNSKYVIKKTTKKKAVLELENAKKLDKVMCRYYDQKYKIIPIIPKVEIVDDNAFLISKYEGYTLQEYIYNNEIIPLEFIDFTNILDYMLNNNIAYRGFIPRNIIMKNNNIYLIDFEDMAFLETNKKAVSLSFYTNIILNWQYFYDYPQINNYLMEKNLLFEENQNLNNYETVVKKLIGFTGDNIELRKKINEVVIFSEKPAKISERLNNNYTIAPTDLAHLFCDLTNYEYDAYFDLINFNVRNKYENIYIYYLTIFSRIIYLFKNNIKKLRKYTFIVFILYLENIIDKKNRIEFTRNFSTNKFNELLYNSSSISKLILKKKFNEFSVEYVKLLKNNFRMFFKSSDNCAKLANNMNEFLIRFMNEEYR